MVNAKLIAVVLVAGVGISTFVALSTTYHSNSDALSADSTVGEVCAEMAPELMTIEIEKLCKDANDVPLFEEIGCATEDDDSDASFTFGEIITAEDLEAAYDAVVARCSPGGRRLGDVKKERFERKLGWNTNWGWCSMDFGFVVGFAGDTANYCDPNQHKRSCNGNRRCGDSLSNCCITHDQCLQATSQPGVSATTKCSGSTVAGQCCDKRLSSCAWNVNCWSKCGWRDYGRCYNVGMSLASTAVAGVMGGVTPQQSWNTGGSRC